MGAQIESESHQCFRFNNSKALAGQIQTYFSSVEIKLQTDSYTMNDPQFTLEDQAFKDLRKRLFDKLGPDRSVVDKIMQHPIYVKAQTRLLALRSSRHDYHRGRLIHGRLTVLESVLRLVQKTPGFSELRADLRRVSC